MIQKILPATLIANLFFIISINEKYLAINGLWMHLLMAAVLVLMAFYATTSTARQRLVIVFFTLFAVLDLGYFWLNESTYLVNRLTYYQSPSLFFEIPPGYLTPAWLTLTRHPLSILGYVVILTNILCWFIKPSALFNAPQWLGKLGQAELPIVALTALTLLASFPAMTHTIESARRYHNTPPAAEGSSYHQMIEKIAAFGPAAKQFIPTIRRTKEGIGSFEAFKLNDKIAYYSTDCDRLDLKIRFYVHYHPENIQDIPESRQKYKFDNIPFAFAERGLKYNNLCYTEQPLPSYPVLGYRTGQYSQATKNLWAAALL